MSTVSDAKYSLAQTLLNIKTLIRNKVLEIIGTGIIIEDMKLMPESISEVFSGATISVEGSSVSIKDAPAVSAPTEVVEFVNLLIEETVSNLVGGILGGEEIAEGDLGFLNCDYLLQLFRRIKGGASVV